MSEETLRLKLMSLSERQRERQMIWVKCVNEFAGFTLLGAESMHSTVLWAVTPCNLAEAHQLASSVSKSNPTTNPAEKEQAAGSKQN
jgi:hypothetical protein